MIEALGFLVFFAMVFVTAALLAAFINATAWYVGTNVSLWYAAFEAWVVQGLRSFADSLDRFNHPERRL